MKTKQRHARPLAPWARHFEASSVLLFAALTFGTGAVNAQTGTQGGSAGGAGTSSSRSVIGPSNASPSTAGQATFGGGATAPAANTGRSEGSTQASSASDAAFQRADKDHDGMLSPQEAALLPAIGNRFQALDKNKDQMLSREEYEAGLKS
ncbi:EF-hand domain-containing protein [Acidovorax sp. DW039]|uniref:EF-hand domain-containing protein n=1 Tax=Acidovorax sp. DW039 TaxID=3095606 RepID=UPI0030881AA6|nr:EF-hand domain-containing protein [Acidovorax sp. DW039]